MRMPDLPDIPSLPDPGEIVKTVEDIGAGVGVAVGGAVDMAKKVVGQTAGGILDNVNRIRNFVQDQIDGILGSAINAAHSVTDVAVDVATQVRTEVESELDLAFKGVKKVADDLGLIPAEAQELLDDGEKILKRAKLRRDEIKAWKERFRARRKRIPKLLLEHLYEFETELEAELDQSAIEAEQIGEKAFDQSKAAYEKTVGDAKHYGTLLISQTENNRNRAVALKANIGADVHAAREWADRHIHRVTAFKTQRMSAAGNIQGIDDAQNWATATVTEAHSIASEIQADLAAKPSEIMTAGQRRVNEAMSLAESVKHEVDTAKEWLATQRGTNAAWKKAMRDNRQSAVAFLEGQSARLLIKAQQHEARIEIEVASLATDQVKDTKAQVGGIESDVKQSGRDLVTDSKKDREDFGQGAGKDKEHLESGAGVQGGSHRGNIDGVMEMDAGVDGGSDHNQIGEADGVLRIEQSAGLKGGKAGAGGVPKSAAGAAAGSAASGKKPDPKKNETATTGANAGSVSGDIDKSKEKEKQTAASVPTVGESEKDPKKSEISAPSSKSVSEKPTTGVAGSKAGEAESSAPAQTSQQTPPASPVAGSSSGKANEVPPKPKTTSLVPTGADVSLKTDKKGETATAGPKGAAIAGQAKHESPPKSEKAPPKAGETSAIPKVAGADKKDAEKSTGALGVMAAGAAQKPAGKNPPKPAAGMATPKLDGVQGQVQKKSAGPQQPDDPKQLHEKLKTVSGPGESPAPDTRQELAKHIGFDPKMVRFHKGPEAAAAAQALGADAFTIGKDVFFGDKKFDPTTPKGLGLIAHEVTHVGQQLGLKGNKLQFLTKTGGDAMEQEAQDVGERVASNVSFTSSLRVGKYIRTYEPADDEPVTTALMTKLDRLSLQALKKAGFLLGQTSSQRPIRLDEISVDISIDTEELSDSEIIDVWAEAIASAIQAAPPSESFNAAAESPSDAATHLLQKRLGDPANEPVKTEVTVDPAVLERIAKISASAQDKDMIRKLLVRKEVDPYIKAVMARRGGYGKYAGRDPGAGSLPQPQMPHQAVDPDERIYMDKLKEVGVNSLEEFEQLKKDFITAFQAKGVNVSNFLLEENLKVVRREKSRYLSKNAKDPNAPINTIKTAAKEVKDAMQPHIDAINNLLARLEATGMPVIPAANTSNLDSTVAAIKKGMAYGIHPTEEELNALNTTFANWDKIRKTHGSTHVVLLGRDFDPSMITEASDDGDLELKMFNKIKDVEDSILYAQGEMSPEKFWELPEMVSMTKKQMGVHDEEGAGITVQETLQGKANDAMLWGIIQAAAAIALAVTAMVATGGLAAVAMIGSAGLSVYSAAKATDDYMFKQAAVNSSLDQAKLLSKDDPSFLWLAVELIGAGLDVAGAVGAFGKLAKAFKALASDKAALKQLEDAARGAYKEAKGIAMSEDDFVARMMEVAKKGAPDVEVFAKQARVLTELLEGTSARAVAIMKGDRAAIKSIIVDHGNWKGLMGGLTNGGEDAAKMSKNISAYRNEIVADFKARGASPLEDASAEAVSDFDLNVVAKDGEGAGERLLKFEKEMAASHGEKWSEALHMNFYTDKKQLMSVEEAMKLVSPGQQKQIMARVTENAERLNFAKMLEHAGENPAAREQVLQMMKDAGVKYSLAELDGVIAKLVGKDKEASRAAKLLDVDKQLKELEKLPPKDPRRAALAEQITEAQMEANFLSKEAYISPSAVKGGALSNSEVYSNALSQLEMISHVIHDSGGDILKACREYELYKYINRYAAAAKKAGLESPRLTFFENYSHLIYRRAKTANTETAHLPGATGLGEEAAENAVDGKFLLDSYNEFRAEVKETLPKMKAASDKNPAAGWKPEMKQPGPAAGNAPGPKAAPEGPPGIKDYSKPGGALDPAKTAGLPAASVKVADAAKKMAQDKGAGKPGPLSSQNAVTSAGFGHGNSMQGIGMFKTHIPGVAKEVLVTVMPAEEESKFNQQLASAIAAAGTGLGPKVHGKVDVGEKKLGFATDTVDGGIADAFNNSKDTDAAQQTENHADMLRNALNINGSTFIDVENFRNAIWDAGVRYTGPVEGFVGADGHWKPINYYNTKGFTADTVLTLARQEHDTFFDALKNDLMQNHLSAKKKQAK